MSMMNIFPRSPLTPPNAIKYGVDIVRKIFAENDCPNGLKTAEIYQLAIQYPIPEGYRGDRRFAPENHKLGPHKPPNNDHPVRSVAFLKRHILPVLQDKEIQKVVVKREITEPVFTKNKKGKVLKVPTKLTAGASPTNPITIKAFAWKPMEPPQEEEPKQVREPFGAPVGVGQDFSHLSKRRQAAREEKIQRDVKKMRQLEAQKKQKDLSL